ncbi:hypothetical protein CCR95_16715 [Thiocystis minor]|uniref:hypothetical protein n=1 Tax=Thiocystis minor TaxID=61597 RepID=UPI0019148951|nr:hypothetical protein [Thiocystis minor]MBK5965681.1 hypothetical protein [Thiocystis minor]
MLRQTKGKQRGFSLDEALISLAVLSSGLLSLAQFQGQMHENSSQTKTQTTAVNLAQQKLEALRDQASTNYSGIIDSRDIPQAHAGDNTGFRRHWTVTPHASPAYKEVSVTTDWQAFDGTEQSVTISSYLAPSAPFTGGLGNLPTMSGREADDAEQRHRDEESNVANRSDAGAESDGEGAWPIAQATCICKRSGSSQQAQLDARSSHPDCSNTCCQNSWSASSEGACNREDCEFVAQCRSG